MALRILTQEVCPLDPARPDGPALIMTRPDRRTILRLMALLQRLANAGDDDRMTLVDELWDLAAEHVVGWRGVTPRLLTERYRVGYEADAPVGADDEIPFDASVLDALARHVPAFWGDLTQAVVVLLQRLSAQTEELAKKSPPPSPDGGGA